VSASTGTMAPETPPAGSDPDLIRHRQWFPWSGGPDVRHPAIKKALDDRTLGERVADRIASFGGSWPFIFLFLGMIAAWMVVNTLFLARVLHHRQFDPYPYIALNLALSATAGLQAPIIMMSQNRAAARDEALAGHHYEESQKIENIVENQRSLLEQNTEITRQVQELLTRNTDLTQKVHDLTEKIHTLMQSGRGS
jgi:uncharacterized membrane protein